MTQTKQPPTNPGRFNRIYEGLNKFLGEHFEVHIPWPSDDTRHLEELTGYKNNAGQMDIPEMDETNCADQF